MNPARQRCLSILAFAALLIAGCAYKVDKRGGAKGIGMAGPPAELVQRVSYRDVSRIFQARCVSCHGNSGGVNLDSYPNAGAALDRIWQSTIAERRMPKAPMPDLTDDERMTLWAWIVAKGPEFPLNGSHQEKPPQVVLEPKFDSILAVVLEKKCVLCHQPGGKAERVPLLTRSDLLDSPLDIVIPGNAEESGLILVTAETARKRMPPADSGFAPLSAEETEVIKAWINAGAKD
jgi:uncharacterized membrane protein